MTNRATGIDKILPCFLDRITDNYPRATRESREHRVVTVQQYRDSVLRDLSFLLNYASHPAAGTFEGFGHVKKSVVNYGIRNLSGVWTSNRNAEDIVSQIRTAILNFEPRILKHTLQVNSLPKEDGQNNAVLNIEIAGELWVEPVAEKLYIKTEIDLETGICSFS